MLACLSEGVAQSLSTGLQAYSGGVSHDELTWLDVQEHAVRILSASKHVLFINSAELITRPDLVEAAQATGFQIVAVPQNLTKKIEGITDISGKPVTELRQFIKQHNESFQFAWVLPEALTPAERAVWNHVTRILDFIGGRPVIVRDIRISETMHSDPYSSRDTMGLWDPSNCWIIVKRTQVRELPLFAGTLLHEAMHAKYALSDVSREFESCLTQLAG